MLVEPGCWLETMWGPAVCTSVSETRSFVLEEGSSPPRPSTVERFTCTYRYEANRPIYKDGEIVGWQEPSIWVHNGDHIAETENDPEWFARYLGPADEVSRHVLTLKGPYGED